MTTNRYLEKIAEAYDPKKKSYGYHLGHNIVDDAKIGAGVLGVLGAAGGMAVGARIGTGVGGMLGLGALGGAYGAIEGGLTGAVVGIPHGLIRGGMAQDD